MRIVDTEDPLTKDFIDELEVIVSRQNPSFTVHAGRHPILGKVVVIEGKEGDSLIVEADE